MKNTENKEYLYLTFRRLFASVMILSTLSIIGFTAYSAVVAPTLTGLYLMSMFITVLAVLSLERLIEKSLVISHMIKKRHRLDWRQEYYDTNLVISLQMLATLAAVYFVQFDRLYVMTLALLSVLIGVTLGHARYKLKISSKPALPQMSDEMMLLHEEIVNKVINRLNAVHTTDYLTYDSINQAASLYYCVSVAGIEHFVAELKDKTAFDILNEVNELARSYAVENDDEEILDAIIADANQDQIYLKDLKFYLS